MVSLSHVFPLHAWMLFQYLFRRKYSRHSTKKCWYSISYCLIFHWSGALNKLLIIRPFRFTIEVLSTVIYDGWCVYRMTSVCTHGRYFNICCATSTQNKSTKVECDGRWHLSWFIFYVSLIIIIHVNMKAFLYEALLYRMQTSEAVYHIHPLKTVLVLYLVYRIHFWFMYQ